MEDENRPAARVLALDPPPGESPFPDMIWIPGGTFTMGSDEFYPEESPVHRATVAGVWIDRAPVTVREFRRFVKSTAHVTAAERAPKLSDYPDADPALLVPGSLVFQGTRGPVALDDSRAWWRYVPGTRWNRPEGPTSHTYTRANHPVTHVALADAQAYAAWAGKTLPTEAEWERAARGGLDGKRFAWGDGELLGEMRMANTWQGEFPLGRHRRGRLARHVARRCLPAQQLRTARHHRKCLGVDRRSLPAGGGVTEPVLRTGATRPRRLRVERHQGRLTSLRSQLLPALPACRPPGRNRRHLHKPHRLSLRRSPVTQKAAADRR